VALFGRSKSTEKKAGEALAARAFQTVARISKAGEVDDVLRSMLENLRDLFQCQEVSVAVLVPGVGTGEVSWSLDTVAGKNKGTQIQESDCKLMPALKIGNFILSSDAGTEDVQLKTSAVAFRDNKVLGCQAFKGRVSLHESPTPDNDLGDGRVTALAIPLNYESHATIIAENIKLGVLTLYGVPLRSDISSIQREIGTMLAQTLAFSRHTYKDPLMGLRSESEIKNEACRHAHLFEFMKSRIGGGLVFGLVDSLTHYKKTIENETDVGAETASQFVNDVLRGVGQCINARSMLLPLSDGRTYRSGVSGRFGSSGFVCVLPLLQEDELVRFSRALQNDVKEYQFPGETLLEEGGITLSVRIMHFQKKFDAEMLWMQVRDEMSTMYREQSQARGTAKLRDFTGTISCFTGKKWISFELWKEHWTARKTKEAEEKAKAQQPKAARPGSSPDGRRPGAGPRGPHPSGRPGSRGPRERSSGQRSAGQRSAGQRSAGQRPTGQRPTGQRPTGQRPTGQRPTGQRPRGPGPRGPRERPRSRPD
jgi:hypothetical protein